MELGKYSFGTGDRFAYQGKAQLAAIIKARDIGLDLTPVWNKSNREHQIIGTLPVSVRLEADQAIKDSGFDNPYFVDADHINMESVDPFIDHSDFFTLDVAAYIGNVPDSDQIARGRAMISKLEKTVNIAGLDKAILLPDDFLEEVLRNYLLAIEAASELYAYIVEKKGTDNFIAEVSMDEVDTPQSPNELLIILALLAEYKIPVRTIAPKFSGRFNKGVDYVGDLELFREEFESDLLVIKYAIEEFGLPSDLKLSIHSGSDKFSIYPIIGELIRKHDMGIHVKTAGTTWLEEIIGLSKGDSQSLLMVKEIYKEAYLRQHELCSPYADVIDIKKEDLPQNIDKWSSEETSAAFRHIPDNSSYNPSMRQLMHVAYKLAAERGDEFRQALKRNELIIAREVEENLFERHIKRLF
ncbi:MAG: hypothetical protein HN352_03965 [Bacteroidetes bacterium]|nr:hypothetical protein [Bacteroidota bacterium]MBT3751548.1 hypothetical protein [Bacteroidota bacterium]MBT4402219.1 hypothetical protein [Bacteroidota bacterium]MBT4411331.1 hypothetical protein [Bacteroidota bacterium]MBT5427436.1 hypothetical protein [Bacteroidota bacterium]